MNPRNKDDWPGDFNITFKLLPLSTILFCAVLMLLMLRVFQQANIKLILTK